jgi:hypothetical protein
MTRRVHVMPSEHGRLSLSRPAVSSRITEFCVFHQRICIDHTGGNSCCYGAGQQVVSVSLSISAFTTIVWLGHL